MYVIYYNNATWEATRLNSPATWLFFQQLHVRTYNKENTNAPHYWPLVRECASESSSKRLQCDMYVEVMTLSWLVDSLSKVILNILCPSDDIRGQSILAQVMAWCLPTPSHYQNKCWLSISKAHHLRAISQEVHRPSITKINLKSTYQNFIEISQHHIVKGYINMFKLHPYLPNGSKSF